MAGQKNTEEKKSAGFQRKKKQKVCYFCKEKIDRIDYKDLATLRKFLSEKGKIRARRVTGNCRQHQNELSKAIKNAREIALLPYPRK